MPEGKVTRARFFEGLMRSAARLTYTKVAAYLANPAADASSRKSPRRAAARRNCMLCSRRCTLRALQRGALDFDAPELKVRFDDAGRIAAFVEQPRNDAHRLIEECMIAANVQAARFLKKHRIPTLYRVHGQPEEDRLETAAAVPARASASNCRRIATWSRRISSAVLQRAAGNEEAHLIQTVVVRSMPQAVYQPENIGHFGLALPEYAHFTSPIRRYPDLMVHRGIRHVLRGGTAETFRAGRARWLRSASSARSRSGAPTRRRAMRCRG